MHQKCNVSRAYQENTRKLMANLPTLDKFEVLKKDAKTIFYIYIFEYSTQRPSFQKLVVGIVVEDFRFAAAMSSSVSNRHTFRAPDGEAYSFKDI